MHTNFLPILLLVIAQCNARGDFIDPYSIDIDSDDEIDPFSISTDTQSIKKAVPSQNTENHIAMLHFQRTLGLFLNILRKNEASRYKGRIIVDVSEEAYNFIREFTKQETNDVDWNEIDLILSEVFRRSMKEDVYDMLITWREYFQMKLCSRECIAFLCIVLFSIFTYNLMNANIKIGSIVKYLLLLGFIVDFFFTYIKLIQDKELERMAELLQYQKVPKECNPSNMSIMEYLSFKLGGHDDTCKKYHKLMYTEVFYSVNPFRVFGTQLGVLVETPANAMGAALGKFMQGVTQYMSWYIIPILVPIILIFSLLILCILLSFLTKTSFGFNLLYLIQFNFGKENHDRIGDVLSGRNLERMLHHVMHKPVIQEMVVAKKKEKPEKVVKKITNTPENENIKNVPAINDKNEEMESEKEEKLTNVEESCAKGGEESDGSMSSLELIEEIETHTKS